MDKMPFENILLELSAHVSTYPRPLQEVNAQPGETIEGEVCK